MSHTFKSGTITTTPYSDSNGGTIMVEQDAYLISATSGIDLAEGPWTVTVNGTLTADGDNTAALRLTAFDGPKNSKLTIGSEATIYDDGASGIAVRLDQTTDVTNAGVVQVGMGAGSYGIDFEAAFTHDKFTVTNTASGLITGDRAIQDDSTATMTLNNAGSIAAFNFAIHATAGSAVISNTGTIAAVVKSIQLGEGDDKVTNSGIIDGVIGYGEGNNVLMNKGTITGTAGALEIAFGGGNDTATNSGHILGNLDFGKGNNAFTNSSVTDGTATFGDGNSKLTNSGQLGEVVFGNGNDTVTNTGTITTAAINALTFGTGDHTVTNGGTIDGAIFLTGGTNSFTNTVSGTLADTLVLAGSKDSVKNSGEIDSVVDFFGANGGTLVNTGIMNGEVFMTSGHGNVTNSGTILEIVTGTGDDKVTNTGTVLHETDLGAGNDIFIGGSHADLVLDGTGNDSYKLGGGDDTYKAVLAGDSTDAVDGGTGNDTYDASGNSDAVLINLDTVGHFIAGPVIVPAGTAIGQSGAGSTETVSGFETIIGTNDTTHSDHIWGGKANETLNGLDGDDFLSGGAGNDNLQGGKGADSLTGGLGVDVLTGGAGDDTFVFESAKDSGTTRATRDTITDFEGNSLSVHDVIDLSGIDADTKTINDQAFKFIGMDAPFTHTAGELHAMFQGAQTIVEGDTNGDGKANFAITLQTHVTLAAANFDL